MKVRKQMHVNIENTLLLGLLYTKSGSKVLRTQVGNRECEYGIDRRDSLKL